MYNFNIFQKILDKQTNSVYKKINGIVIEEKKYTACVQFLSNHQFNRLDGTRCD